jgi:hypothetical protein
MGVRGYGLLQVVSRGRIAAENFGANVVFSQAR